MSGGVLFGSQVWDPVQIVAQIVAIQCLFYMSLGLIAWLLLGQLIDVFTGMLVRVCCLLCTVMPVHSAACRAICSPPGSAPAV